jgi:hypothetical protein
MITFLYSLSDLNAVALFGTVIALMFAGAPLLRIRVLGQVSEAHSEIARTTMTTVTGFTGVVLAFSLVQAQANLRSIEKTVATEAVQLNQMDRLLTSYGDPNVAEIRAVVRAYAGSVVTDEWPRLSEHSGSSHTGDLFRVLSQQVLAIRPTSGHENVIYGDLVKILDQLAESREELLDASDLGLPPIFWEVITFLTLLLVTFCAFVEPQRAVFLGGLGAGLGVLIGLVVVFDQPFLGKGSLTPDPIVRVLHIISTR